MGTLRAATNAIRTLQPSVPLVPLDALRVGTCGDSLHIAGQSMAGFLMVPAYAPEG